MQTKIVDGHEAQAHLAELLSLVTAGAEIILTEGSTPRWRASCLWLEPPHHVSQACTLAPSGPARTLMNRCPRSSRQACHEGAIGYACLHPTAARVAHCGG